MKFICYRSGHLPGGVDVQDGTTYSLNYWYVFVEAEAANPKAMPLMVWSNGGPVRIASCGCAYCFA